LPTPHFNKATHALDESHDEDPFNAPYNPTMLIGEIVTDDGSYAVLVSDDAGKPKFSRS